MKFSGEAPTLRQHRPWSPLVADTLDSLPAERARVLKQRLEHELPNLRSLLEHLYGRLPNFESFLSTLLVSTLRAAQQRDADLWALDLAREHDPAWHQRGMVGYCAYVDKFAGTLDGVQQRIGYLQELGVTYLHLLPFLKAGKAPNDGGFAVASFAEIEPTLGDMNALKSLCRALRGAGISLCSDLVLNHVAEDHAWARAARAADPSYREYFHWLDSEEAVREQEQHLVQIFPATAPGNFTYVAEQNAWVWTTFYPCQWDLNYANPAVFADMAAAMLHLANHGVEAFRLDSTGFLWKRPGTNCMNQPEVHLIVQAMRSLTAIASPAVLLKAEAIMPTQELPPYFGLGPVRGPECHIAYHSSLMAASWVALTEENPEVVSEVLAHTPDLPTGCSWLTYVRCHDDIGWNVLRPELAALGSDPLRRLARAASFLSGETEGSYARGARFQASDPSAVHGTNGMTAALTGLTGAGRQGGPQQELALQRIALMYAMSFFVGGLPLIYMGDELGLDNTSASELQARQGPDGRELHRPFMDEVALRQRHDPTTIPGQLFGMLRKLITVRQERLGHGAPLQIRPLPLSCASVLCLRRNGQMGLFNFSRKPVRVALQELGAMPLQDMFSGAQLATDTLELGPYGVAWLNPAEHA